MARPTRCRRICTEPAYDSFVPEGIGGKEQVFLTLDEYEAVRLIDLDKYTHVQCAEQMDISRTTVTELYESARYKIADCIVNGKSLYISGGHYRFCDGSASLCCGKKCRRGQTSAVEVTVKMKGEKEMRIAVTYENGTVFQHFGHTEEFKLYDIENGKITGSEVVSTNGQGHGALAGFLTRAGVDVLICGGIGGGAQSALKEMGIKLYGGVSGSADGAVEAYLEDRLDFNPDVQCSHHEHEHSCGEHQCGENKHGCSGN